MPRPSASALDAAENELILTQLRNCVNDLRRRGLIMPHAQQVILNLSPRDGNIPSLRHIQQLVGGIPE